MGPQQSGAIATSFCKKPIVWGLRSIAALFPALIPLLCCLTRNSYPSTQNSFPSTVHSKTAVSAVQRFDRAFSSRWSWQPLPVDLKPLLEFLHALKTRKLWSQERLHTNRFAKPSFKYRNRGFWVWKKPNINMLFILGHRPPPFRNVGDQLFLPSCLTNSTHRTSSLFYVKSLWYFVFHHSRERSQELLPLRMQQ